MLPRLAVGTAVTALSVLLALPALAEPKQPKAACEEGKILVRSECVAACPTTGRFADPSACECPPGYGKILAGSGGAECGRLACATGAAVDEKSCDCPDGYEKKPAGKGKVKCTLPVAKAKAKTKAT